MKNRFILFILLMGFSPLTFCQVGVTYKIELGDVSVEFETVASHDGLSTEYISGDSLARISNIPIHRKKVQSEYVMDLEGNVHEIKLWSGIYNVQINAKKAISWLNRFRCNDVKLFRNNVEVACAYVDIHCFSNILFVELTSNPECSESTSTLFGKQLVRKLCNDGGIVEFYIEYIDDDGTKSLRCGVLIESKQEGRTYRKYKRLIKNGKLSIAPPD